jgi:sigma-B regulation protein RsbU (phosphoserine phosphatase)
MDLRPGDVLVLYTDGVTEAINDHEEEFGEQRLLSVIMENRTLPAAELLEKILDAISTFAGNRPQHDDITLLILHAV